MAPRAALPAVRPGRKSRELVSSVPQRLAGFERVLNPLERLALAAELQKRLALEIEQVLFRDGRLMRQRSARQNPRERPADERVVIADASGTPGQMDAELERGLQAVAADRNRGPRRQRVVALARALERDGLRVG